MNTTPAKAVHGLKLITQKGNQLVCIVCEGTPYFFYTTPGCQKYLPGDYTRNTGLMLQKTEWNFLSTKTEPTSMTKEEIEAAEMLLPYINQDRKYSWTLEKAKASNKIQPPPISTEKLCGAKGFASLHSLQFVS